jgi:hypothetical protein
MQIAPTAKASVATTESTYFQSYSPMAQTVELAPWAQIDLDQEPMPPGDGAVQRLWLRHLEALGDLLPLGGDQRHPARRANPQQKLSPRYWLFAWRKRSKMRVGTDQDVRAAGEVAGAFERRQVSEKPADLAAAHVARLARSWRGQREGHGRSRGRSRFFPKIFFWLSVRTREDKFNGRRRQ